MKIAEKIRTWMQQSAVRSGKPRNLDELSTLLMRVALEAELYAYTTSPHREELPKSEGWKLFRQRAEELSRAYPTLRPLLGKFYLALEGLKSAGYGRNLPRGTYDHILFSESNPCHAPYRELKGLLDAIHSTIQTISTTG